MQRPTDLRIAPKGERLVAQATTTRSRLASSSASITLPRLLQTRKRKAPSRLSYFYLATPYTRYPNGQEQAFKDAAQQAALLVLAGVPTFCPIAHSHPMVPYVPMNKDNHDTWLILDNAFMDAAYGMILCQMEGWDQSFGIAHEVEYMRAKHKPIIWMTPGVIPSVLLGADGRYQKPDSYQLARENNV